MQNAIKSETLPELKANMDRPGFAMLLGGDSRRIDRYQLPAAGVPRGLRWEVLAPLAHLTNDGGDFGIALIDQALLTEQSIFDFARELEPLLARPCAEVAERADGLLPWPLRDLHRLDQDVIGVRLANRPITEARRPYIIATSSGALDKAAALKARTSRP